MAHNLFGSRFVGQRKAAWHNLGTVIDNPDATMKEALALGGIDFIYHECPVEIVLPGGTHYESGKHKMIMREPTADDTEWAEMGLVSLDYSVIQNATLAEGLDRVRQRTGWTFETVGALGKGETVFLTLNAGEKNVFGDGYTTHFGVIDGKGGSRGLTILAGQTRIVCANTVAIAEQSAKTKIVLSHNQVTEMDYNAWLNVFTELQVSQDEAFKTLEAMANQKIKDSQAKAIFTKAWPDPKPSETAMWGPNAIVDLTGLSDADREVAEKKLAHAREHVEWWQLKQKARREAAFQNYQLFNQGEEQGVKTGGHVITPETLAHIQGSAYAAYQVVAEIVDHGGRMDAKVGSNSALFGEGAKTKRLAMDAALALVK